MSSYTYRQILPKLLVSFSICGSNFFVQFSKRQDSLETNKTKKKNAHTRMRVFQHFLPISFTLQIKQCFHHLGAIKVTCCHAPLVPNTLLGLFWHSRHGNCHCQYCPQDVFTLWNTCPCNAAHTYHNFVSPSGVSVCQFPSLVCFFLYLWRI